jgi:hypothetical protein
MTWEDLCAGADPRWAAAPPAAPEALRALVDGAGLSLPSDYLAFLSRSNGGDGFLDVQPCYLRLWPAEEILANNRDYAILEHMPGYFAFGDAGGEEFFAFDTRQPGPWKVYSIPYLPMVENKAILVANSFGALLAHLTLDSD